MGSLLAELEAREAAAQARAEALRARIAELTEQLTAEEELCSRLGITRQTVLEILGGGDDSGWGVLEEGDWGRGGVEQDGDGAVRAALRLDGPVARAVLAAAPAAARVGVGAVTVPVWQPGMEETVLPVAYRDVLEVLADAGKPLRTRQTAAALGLGEQRRSVEGLRLKLKRLVRRGWLAEPEVGLFVRRPGDRAESVSRRRAERLDASIVAGGGRSVAASTPPTSWTPTGESRCNPAPPPRPIRLPPPGACLLP